MITPSIHQIALRRAADAVTASLAGELPLELANAPLHVQEEYTRELTKIAAILYRRAALGAVESIR